VIVFGKLALGIAVAILALMLLVFVVKAVFALAIIVLAVLAGLYAVNFVRAFVRRLTADQVGAPTTPAQREMLAP
jgi:membrane protein implicated in regulation of membrane protease activity